jgi:hypothetical protein
MIITFFYMKIYFLVFLNLNEMPFSCISNPQCTYNYQHIRTWAKIEIICKRLGVKHGFYGFFVKV